MVFIVHAICGAENSENLEKSLKCPFRWLTLVCYKSQIDPFGSILILSIPKNDPRVQSFEKIQEVRYKLYHTVWPNLKFRDIQ